MQKKLTITIDEEVYEGLHKTIGPRKISKFVEELVRPHVVHPDLDSAYADMAGGLGSGHKNASYLRELLLDLPSEIGL